MPNPAKESDQNALPDPELNPLLNPLLAANMGRWAEVYFTTPPERREQAVADLLRELESASPAESDLQVLVEESELRQEPIEREAKTETEANESLESPAATVQSGRICNLCGHSNQEGHKFCGMCGAPLETLEDRISRIAQSQQSAHANADDRLPRFGHSSIDYANTPEERFTAPLEQKESVEHDWPQSRNFATDTHYATDNVPHFGRNVPHFPSEAPNFHQYVPRFADQAPRIEAQRSGVPYRYRIFVGIGLAILLAALIYMARRGTGALSDAAQSPPSRVIPAAQPQPTQPAPVAPQPPAAASDSANSAEEAGRAKGAVAKPSKAPIPSAKREASLQNQPNSQASAPSTPIGGSSSAPSTELTGAEDLAMAQKYLNISDRKEAVPLLWRAVGKGNAAATIVLSDLYLRGDGVPKSCDQAHLLLDAAARKGVKGAADRLRNLQAFGCQ